MGANQGSEALGKVANRGQRWRQREQPLDIGAVRFGKRHHVSGEHPGYPPRWVCRQAEQGVARLGRLLVRAVAPAPPAAAGWPTRRRPACRPSNPASRKFRQSSAPLRQPSAQRCSSTARQGSSECIRGRCSSGCSPRTQRRTVLRDSAKSRAIWRTGTPCWCSRITSPWTCTRRCQPCHCSRCALVIGERRVRDRRGHHGYRCGCRSAGSGLGRRLGCSPECGHVPLHRLKNRGTTVLQQVPPVGDMDGVRARRGDRRRRSLHPCHGRSLQRRGGPAAMLRSCPPRGRAAGQRRHDVPGRRGPCRSAARDFHAQSSTPSTRGAVAGRRRLPHDGPGGAGSRRSRACRSVRPGARRPCRLEPGRCGVAGCPGAPSAGHTARQQRAGARQRSGARSRPVRSEAGAPAPRPARGGLATASPPAGGGSCCAAAMMDGRSRGRRGAVMRDRHRMVMCNQGWAAT